MNQADQRMFDGADQSQRNPEVHAAGTEAAVGLLEELACMTRAGVPWQLGLSGLAQGSKSELARLAEQLQADLEQGKDGRETLGRLEASLGKPAQDLLDAVTRNRNPGAFMDGLLATVRARQRERRRLRGVMVYPLATFVFTAALFIASWFVALRPDQLSDVIQSGFHPRIPPRPWWPLPAMIGAMIPIIFMFVRASCKTNRPEYWRRKAWFAELVAIQVERGEPLPEAVERAAQTALLDPTRTAALSWSQQSRQGAIPLPHAELGGMLGWILRRRDATPEWLASSLRVEARLMDERGVRVAGFWEKWLPLSVTSFAVGGLAISFFLLAIEPLYRFSEM